MFSTKILNAKSVISTILLTIASGYIWLVFSPYLPEDIPIITDEKYKPIIPIFLLGSIVCYLTMVGLERFIGRRLGHTSAYVDNEAYYDDREQLPDFLELLERAQRTFEMLITSSRFEPAKHKKEFIAMVNRGVQTRIVFLDLNSSTDVTTSEKAVGSGNLISHIENQEKEINVWRAKEVLNQENLIVERYTPYAGYSIIVIDRNDTENAMIQIEFYDIGDTMDRRSRIVFKRGNTPKFSEYLRRFDTVNITFRHP